MAITHISDKKTLIVNDKTFIALAGEVHNSSCSNIQYFKEHVLSKIKDIPLNTLLLPIYFEDIEREEGVYNFDTIKGLIDACRQQKYKIIFLWYGLWKNGLSTYIPHWMKKDQETYMFCRNKEQNPLYTISPFCKRAIKKDAQALYQVMQFIKTYDEKEQTVIMVQIENEVGLLESTRDYSTIANIKFYEHVPSEVEQLMNKKGNWSNVFDKNTDEKFMTYYYAKSIETIAHAAKEAYPLPLMMNVWIKKENELPGQYPSGGPIIENLGIYKMFAPSIDIFAPDIYVDDFITVCDAYASQGMLAIPETRQDISSMSHCIYAVAKYPLVCFSPFGIEDFSGYNESRRLLDFLTSLGIDKKAFHAEGSYMYLCQIYQDLQNIIPVLLLYRDTSNCIAFLYNNQKYEYFTIGDLEVKVMYLHQENQPKGAGFMFFDGKSYYMYGINVMLEFSTQGYEVGILYLEEGYFEKGIWESQRVLNGDERYNVYVLDIPKMLSFQLHYYK